MKSGALQAALRIALIIEEFREEDILAAVRLLEEHGGSSGILDYLAGRRVSKAAVGGHFSRRVGRSVENQRSKAVINLERTDPEKYRLLSEFDSLIRKGQILATLEDLKRFGERISKNFSPRKSRKETIGSLLALIAARPLNEIEDLIQFAASFGTTGDTDEYQRLAKFLIKGRPEVDEGH